MTMDSLAGVRGVARQHRTQGNTGDPTRRGVRLAPSSGWSRAGSRRGSSYRWHSVDNITTEEGRRPGSRRASTSPGAGDWREPVHSWLAPETPRGAGHHAEQARGALVHAVVRHSSESRMRENRTSGSMSGHGKPLTVVVGGRCVHRNHCARGSRSAPMFDSTAGSWRNR
jgi:hypothetical protein